MENVPSGGADCAHACVASALERLRVIIAHRVMKSNGFCTVESRLAWAPWLDSFQVHKEDCGRTCFAAERNRRSVRPAIPQFASAGLIRFGDAIIARER